MRIAFGAMVLATFLLVACSGPQGPQGQAGAPGEKGDARAWLGRWVQTKAIRVRQAQWDRPVPQASQVSGS